MSANRSWKKRPPKAKIASLRVVLCGALQRLACAIEDAEDVDIEASSARDALRHLCNELERQGMTQERDRRRAEVLKRYPLLQGRSAHGNGG